MKHLRYWIRFAFAFLQKFKKIILGSVVLGALIFVFLPKIGILLSFFSRGQAVGLVGKLSANDLPESIKKKISLGLTTLDQDNNIKPGLASSWVFEQNGKVWIFKLGNHYWQDGSKVTARDINYEFSDAQKEVIDKDTVKFTLKDPFAPFLSVVSRPLFKKGLLGAGDWKVSQFSSLNAEFTQSITITNIKTGEKLTYKFYPTEEAARTAFKLGEVDQINDMVDPGKLINWTNAKVIKNDLEDRYLGIFINIQDPVFGGKQTDIRQALAYAINKQDLPGQRAISTISPNSWAFNPQVKQYLYNPDHTKELLAKARSEKKDPKFEFSINLVTAPSLLPIADLVKKDWEDVGIKTNIQVSNVPPDEFQALLWIQPIPADPDQYSLWHSKQTTTNISNFDTDLRIDKLLEDGRRTLDQEERKKIYLDFQRFLLEDLPVIPLTYPLTYTIERK